MNTDVHYLEYSILLFHLHWKTYVQSVVASVEYVEWLLRPKYPSPVKTVRCWGITVHVLSDVPNGGSPGHLSQRGINHVGPSGPQVCSVLVLPTPRWKVYIGDVNFSPRCRSEGSTLSASVSSYLLPPVFQITHFSFLFFFWIRILKNTFRTTGTRPPASSRALSCEPSF